MPRSVWRSLPALPCLVAWAAGVAGAGVALPATPLIGEAATVGGGVALASALFVRPIVAPVAIAAALFGIARGQTPGRDPSLADRDRRLAGLSGVMTGHVAADPTLTWDGYQARVSVDRIVARNGVWRPAGDVVVSVRNGVPPSMGDTVQVTGRLAVPADSPGFDRRAYLARQGVYLEMREADLQVTDDGTGGPAVIPSRARELYRTAIETLVPEPHAALLLAVVLGVRQGIPTRLRQALIATGLVHLLVLSGLKVAVFARLTTAALRPLLRRWAALPAAGAIALYCLAGGATPAAVRASLMGGIVLLATHLGRPTYVWTSLAWTAAIMLAIAPDLIWDIGFQLSFMGTAAIVLLTPGIERRIAWMPGWFREPFAVTCAAQVGTLPLMVAGFGILSPIAPLANALVLPVLPAMVGGGLLVAPWAALPAVGRVLALPMTAMIQYLAQVATLLARLPAGAISLPGFPSWLGAAYYLALGAGLVASRMSGRPRHAALSVAVLGPVLITVVELGMWAHPAPGVTVLDVGTGQAVVMRGPQGTVLVDGGSNPARLAAALGGVLPPWEHDLTALVITGGGAGHVQGLTGLTYTVRDVFVPATVPNGTAWRTITLSEMTRGASLHELSAGMDVRLAGLSVDVLAPDRSDLGTGQIAFRVRGPAGGRGFCDFAGLDPDQQIAAAAHLAGGCDTLLVPDGGIPGDAVLARLRASRYIVSGPMPRRLPAGVGASSVTATGDEGDVSVPL